MVKERRIKFCYANIQLLVPQISEDSDIQELFVKGYVLIGDSRLMLEMTNCLPDGFLFCWIFSLKKIRKSSFLRKRYLLF